MAQLVCESGGSILTSEVVSEVNNQDTRDIWSYLYYADEDDTKHRVLAMDRENMLLARDIPLTDTAHAGSVDRAGFTDRMYVRSATFSNDPDAHIEVINAVSGKWIKKIPLNYRPRSSGGFNRYRNLQAISTKDEAYCNVIDIDSDTVVITVGVDHTTETIGGNDGGNATGHTVWLDANHFALLDRYRNNIQVYKINEDYPPYTTTLTSTLDTLTGCHSLRSAEAGLLLQDRTFFAAIEGSTAVKDNVLPQLWKLSFDSSTGVLAQVDTMVFPGVTVDWNIHHFGIMGDIIAVPIMQLSGGNGEVFTINKDAWTLTGKQYTAGNGSGHCEGSVSQNMIVVTNHYGNDVTLIDLDDDSVVNVEIATEIESYGTYIQSHANHVTEDGLYYHFFETANGIFMEIDLVAKTLTRQITTGGKPIQSVS